MNMKKSDLKTGMVVVLKDGSRNMVMVNTFEEDKIIDITNGKYVILSHYNEDLKHREYADLDIESIYKSNNLGNLVEDLVNNTFLLFDCANIFDREIDCIQTGDNIKIINIGAVYTTYSNFLENDLDLLGRYVYGEVPNTEEVYKVICSKKHPRKERMVYAIENDKGQIYLIGANGIIKK